MAKMEQYKKHECLVCDSIKTDCPSCGCDRCTEIQRAGWKAALKWIYYEGVLEPTLAGTLIEEELEEELNDKEI